jgi:hypothetical protein
MRRLLICVLLLTISFVGVQIADASTSAEVKTQLACPRGVTLSVYTPRLIAEGRTDFSANYEDDSSEYLAGNNSGFDLIFAPTFTVTQDGKPISIISGGVATQNVSSTSMPRKGDLTVRIDAWSDTYGACEAQTITIPRGDGLVGLTSWGIIGFSLAKNVWTGAWTGEGDNPSGGWTFGSCMPLSTKPIRIKTVTSGGGGSATKTILVDACKLLVPPHSGGKIVKIPLAKLAIAEGRVDFIASTFRGPGTQKYTITATWGSARSVLRLTVTWTPEVIIWQGTDDFVNVCINDSYKIWSKNGQLYCKQVGYPDW